MRLADRLSTTGEPAETSSTVGEIAAGEATTSAVRVTRKKSGTENVSCILSLRFKAAVGETISAGIIPFIPVFEA